MTGEELRQEIFDDSAERLAEMASRAINVLKRAPSETALVAINVDDPSWRELADILMPGADWQQFRDLGQKPVARGSVEWDGMAKLIGELVPSLKSTIDTPPPEGHLYAFVMDGGGASIYAVPYGEES